MDHSIKPQNQGARVAVVNGNGHRVTFDWRLNIYNAAMLLVLVFAASGAWFNISSRVSYLEVAGNERKAIIAALQQRDTETLKEINETQRSAAAQMAAYSEKSTERWTFLGTKLEEQISAIKRIENKVDASVASAMTRDTTIR